MLQNEKLLLLLIFIIVVVIECLATVYWMTQDSFSLNNTLINDYIYHDRLNFVTKMLLDIIWTEKLTYYDTSYLFLIADEQKSFKITKYICSKYPIYLTHIIENEHLFQEEKMSILKFLYNCSKETNSNLHSQIQQILLREL